MWPPKLAPRKWVYKTISKLLDDRLLAVRKPKYAYAMVNGKRAPPHADRVALGDGYLLPVMEATSLIICSR